MIRIARNISTNISRNVSRSIGTEPDPVLERYSGASAAYSLYDLGNRRGTVVETEATYSNPAVRLRRDSDNTHKSFPAGAFTQMQNWVNELGNPYVGYAYFTEQNPDSEVTLTSPITLDAFFDWQITMDVMCAEDYGVAGFGLLGGNAVSTQVGFWLSTGRNALGLTDDAGYFGSMNMGVTMGIGRMHTLTFNYQVGVGVTAQLDDNPASSPNNNFGDITIDWIGESRGREGYRVIKNISITQNGVNTYATDGDGILASNWVDTVGSNDGTPSNLSSYNNEFGQAKATTWYDQSGVQVASVGVTSRDDSHFEGTSVNWSAGTLDTVDNELDLSLGAFAGSNLAGSYAHLPVIGDKLQYRVRVTNYSSGSIKLRDQGGGQDIMPASVSADGLYTGDVDITANFTGLQLIAGSGGFVGSVAEVSYNIVDKAHNDAIQTTADNQPKVVDAGALVTDANGNYSLDFDGNQHFETISGGVLTNIQDTFTVFVGTRRNGSNGFFAMASSPPNRLYIQPHTINIGDPSVFVALGLIDDTPAIATVQGSAGNYTVFKDGVETGTGSTDETGAGSFTLGSNNDYTVRIDGKLAEFIIYNSDQSANREAIEQSLSNTITTALS